MNEAQFTTMKRKVDKALRRAEKAEVEYQAALLDLQRNFEVDSLEEAEELLNTLQEELEDEQKKLNKEYRRFTKRFNDFSNTEES